MPWDCHRAGVLSIDTVSAPLPEDASAAPTAAAAPSAGEGIRVMTGRMALGDDDAFREFHRLYFDRLYRLLLLLCHGQETEAREALQETFCRVARHARRFEDEKVFWCWLVALARSAVFDAGRKRHRYWKLLTDYARRWLPVQSQPVPDHDRQLEALLFACLDELDPADRAIIEGKYFSRRSTAELARETGLTARAVESRLFRLRELLRNRVLMRLRRDQL
jgi:RNA polymerase sigma-70 factor, ECF subfamily